MPRLGPRSLQRRLKRLFDQGWVSRTVVPTEVPGRDPYVYAITRAGFEMTRVRQTSGGTVTQPSERWHLDERRAPSELRRLERDAEREARWRESEKQSFVHIVHDLGAAEWVLRVICDLAANCVLDWEGEEEIRPPGHERDGRWIQKPLAEIRRPSAAELYAGLEEPWPRPRPDAILECEVEESHGVRRFDLFVEYETRLRPNERFARKVRGYDALVTAWGRELPRYRDWRAPGIVMSCARTRSPPSATRGSPTV